MISDRRMLYTLAMGRCVPLLLAGLLLVGAPRPVVAAEPAPDLDRVDALLEAGRFADALDAARAVAAATDDPHGEATALLRISDALYYLGRREETLAPMQQALAIYQAIDDLEGIGRAYYSLAYYYERTDPARMIALLEQGRVYAERSGDPGLRMNIANAMGVALWNQGRYDEALLALAESGTLAQEMGNDPAQAAALQNIGLIHLHRGDNLPALESFEAALALVGDDRSHAVGVILGNCGNAHLGLRDLETALSCYQRSLEIHRRNGYRRGAATQLNNIAGVEEQLQRWDRARELRREVVTTGREIGDARTTIGALTALGQLAMVNQQTDDADSLFREALVEAESFGDPYLIARPQQELARLAFVRGDDDDGFAWLDRAEASSAAVPDAAMIGSTRALRARQWAAAGDLAAAVGELEAAVALHERSFTRTHLHLWYADLARWAAARGDRAAAERRFDQAEQQIEALDALIALGDFRVGLFREVAAVYHDHAAWLARQGRLVEAWSALDRGRARELTLRILGQRRRGEFSADELAALGRLSALQRRLREDAPGPDERQGIQADIADAEDAYDRARLAARLAGDLRAPTVFTLPEAAMTVAFSVQADTMLVFSARDGAIAWRSVPGAGTMLERARRWRELVTDPGSGDLHRAAGARLWDDLLGPELAAGRPRRLVLVPDAPLWALPFGALIGPTGTYLAAETELSTTPSLASLAALSGQPHAPGRRIVALANSRFDAAADPGADPARGAASLRDLAATLGEAERVAALDPDHADVLREPGEDTFKALDLAAVQLLHFATHTLVDAENPDRTCIVLAPGGGEDGFLQAREVARLPLACRLATVSGCGSGSGPAVAGEGLLGMTHALLSAGAHSVVLSGWDVSDEGAAHLMGAFYAALPGRTVGAALRRAQADARESAAWVHPAHWAAFTVAGEGAQRLALPRTGHRRLVAIAGATGAAVLALALVRRRREKIPPSV